MGGCASRPKDLDGRNPDLVPVENPSTSTATTTPVEPTTTTTTKEAPAEVKEEAEEKKDEAEVVSLMDLIPEVDGATVAEPKPKEDEIVALEDASEVKTNGDEKLKDEPVSIVASTAEIVAVEEEVRAEDNGAKREITMVKETPSLI